MIAGPALIQQAIERTEQEVQRPSSVRGHGHYSEADRYGAIVLYRRFGSVREVGRRMGIPRTTIDDWMKTEWWDKEDSFPIGKTALATVLEQQEHARDCLGLLLDVQETGRVDHAYLGSVLRKHQVLGLK